MAILSTEILNRHLRCTKCGSSAWKYEKNAISCGQCGQQFEVTGGVVKMRGGKSDPASNFFDLTGGSRLAEAEFAQNAQVYSATRVLTEFLGQWFPKPAGTLLDLGCGDGRLSLWALEAGFPLVVATDSSLQALQRLMQRASAQGVADRLLLIWATVQERSPREGAFQAVVCSEVLYYLARDGERVKWLEYLASLLSRDGRLVLSEFSRLGRLLADVTAMNAENIRRTALKGNRLEKFEEHSLEVGHPSPAELLRDCAKAGLAVIEKKGISPISMLFQHAYTFTSYPLRPAMDEEMKRVIDALEDAGTETSDFSRNIVLLLKKNGAAHGI